MTTDFATRFEDLYRVAYRAAYTILGMPAEAEDCAQEALARALIRWRTVEHYAPAWVARVAGNLAIDRIRKLQRRDSRMPGVVVDVTTERRRDLVVALRSLPRRQREAVVLRFVLDMPEMAAASAMGCNVGTVKSATSRGLNTLRARLGPTWALED